MAPPTNSPFQVSSGTVRYGVDEPDWNLLDVADENEDRIFERVISYDRPFAVPPVVHVGLGGFDIDNNANARLRVNAVHVGRDNFTIQMETWLNTRMWSVEVNWIAIGLRE